MTPSGVLKKCSELLKAQKGLSTIRLRYPVPGTILAGTGAGTGLEKMAGYPANRNRNRISGTSLTAVFAPRCTILQSAILRLRIACLSVWDVGGSGPHRLKKCYLIARIISPTSFSSYPKRHPPTPRGTQGNCRETRGGLGKVACWSTKAAISVKRIKIEEKLLWRAFRNSPTLFRTVPSPPPTTSPSPRLGFTTSTPTQKLQLL